MRNRGRLVVAALAALAVALLLAPTVASSTSIDPAPIPWVNFTHSEGDDTAPTVLIGPDSTPVAVWTGPDGLLRLSQLPLAGESEDVVPLEGVPRDASPALDGEVDLIAMDAEGRLHVVWDDGSGGVWHRAFDVQGGPAGPAHLLSAVDSVASAPAVVAAAPGSDDAAWVAWVEARGALGVHVRLVAIDGHGSVVASRLVDGYAASFRPRGCDVTVDGDGLPHVTFLGADGSYWALPEGMGAAILRVCAADGSLPLVLDLGDTGLWAAWREGGAVVARPLLEGGTALGGTVVLTTASSASGLPRATDTATVAAGGVAATLFTNDALMALGSTGGAPPSAWVILPFTGEVASPAYARDGRGQSYVAWAERIAGSMDCCFQVLERRADVVLRGPLAVELGMPIIMIQGQSVDLTIDVQSVVGYRAPVELEVVRTSGPATFSARIGSASGLIVDPRSTETAILSLGADEGIVPGSEAAFELVAHPPGADGAAVRLAVLAEFPADAPFAIRTSSDPLPILPGEAVELTFAVQSWSSRDEVVQLQVTTPDGWQAEAPQEVRLAAGEMVEVTIALTAPEGSRAGTVGIIGIDGTTADGGRGAGAVVGAVVQPHAGLTFEPGLSTLAVAPGATAQRELRVRSTGNMPLALALSVEAASTAWSASVTPTELRLAPGSEASVLVEVTAPADATYPSACTVVLTASDGALQLAASAVVRAAAARVVSYSIVATPASVPLMDGGAHLGLLVANDGNSPEALTLASIEGLPPGWAVVSADLRAPRTLYPGESATLSVRLVAPAGASAGTIQLSAVLEGPGAPAVAPFEVVVTREFRLSLSTPETVITLTPPGFAYFPISLLAVGNIGGEAHLSVEGVPSDWDYSFRTPDGQTATAFEVASLGSADAVLAVRVPSSASGDTFPLTVECGDARGTVLARTSLFLRLRFPDLALGELYFVPALPRAGEPATLRVRILNLGGADAEDAVVLLRDGDRVLDRDSISMVPKGAYREAVLYFVPSEGRRTLIVIVDPSASVPDASRTNNMVVRRLDVAAAEEGPVVTTPVIVASVGIAVTASIIGLLGGTEIGRYALFAGLLIPLYTKLMKDQVLDHYLRGKIHGYIIANPGEHYNAIKEQLDVTNGALSYHLRVLEREGYIRSRFDGMYKRFYPSEMKLPRSSRQISSFQEVILTIVKNNQGLSQKDIAKRIGVSSQVINYHIKLLEDADLIKVDRTRRRSRVYATDSPAGLADMADAVEQA